MKHPLLATVTVMTLALGAGSALGGSKLSPDEQSDIRTSFISIPHIVALMRATRLG